MASDLKRMTAGLSVFAPSTTTIHHGGGSGEAPKYQAPVVSVGVRGHRYQLEVGSVLGCGSFGSVLSARCLDTGRLVAVKAVFQDPRYKNRELEIMRAMSHPNVVSLVDYFYSESRPTAGSSSSSTGSESPRFLNLVMEYVPDTIFRSLKSYARRRQFMPMPLVQVYVYQMLRSLAYLHSLGICHRDIKPQNLLIDPKSHILKLCDFGSAKALNPNESSVSYICTRFYRAPELMLGATEYSCAIDVWSVGCVMGELMTGKPLFAGETAVEQLVKIIQYLGSPTKEQLRTMNRQYADYQIPAVPQTRSLETLVRNVCGRTDASASCLDLLSSMLKFVPSERIPPFDGMAHPFFDSLRDPCLRLPPLGVGVPANLFLFTDMERSLMSPEARARLFTNI